MYLVGNPMFSNKKNNGTTNSKEVFVRLVVVGPFDVKQGRENFGNGIKK